MRLFHGKAGRGVSVEFKVRLGKIEKLAKLLDIELVVRSCPRCLLNAEPGGRRTVRRTVRLTLS
jgi:hypothetical protein